MDTLSLFHKESYTVFTDGSSRGNPGPGGFAAIVILQRISNVYSSCETYVSEIGGFEPNTTNNRMELSAVIKGIAYILQDIESKKVSSDDIPVNIYLDSAYVLNGATKWIYGWQKNNWVTSQKTSVENQDLWKELVEALVIVKDKNIKITWTKVKGHNGVILNERCDEIATSFATKENIVLYTGKLETYRIKITTEEINNGTFLNTTQSTSSIKKSSSKNKPAYSYISLVDKKVYIDHSWIDCEKRVKGKSGVKFKKSLNAEDEQNIIADFKKFLN